MKANELKIGNVIFVGNVDIPVKVEGVYKNEVTLEGHERKAGTYDETMFDGIPLTSEILENCGFEWETDKKTHLQKELGNKGSLMTFFFKDSAINEIQLYNYESIEIFVDDSPPKYLHQLQNLYFDLTGEELEINL